MAKAARAIIIKDNKILVMRRDKFGSQYFTLVGGRVNDDETTEQALAREVKEESGLDVTDTRLVFIEEHAPPYNEQYIYLCEINPHESAVMQDASEEAQMNRVGLNIHELSWSELSTFPQLPFRTPQLQTAIVKALKDGFPEQVKKI